MNPQLLSINDFDYSLPDDKIALYPLQERDASKLLVYKNGNIIETVFNDIQQIIPPNSIMFFNNTKVINARLSFKKNTGTTIEIFCLEPYNVLENYTAVMQNNTDVIWKCFIGGAAKWKAGFLEMPLTIHNEQLVLLAEKIKHIGDTYVVKFSWNNNKVTFAEILENTGKVPLPPYIKRVADQTDATRYQTIFATESGSVAAPTAGLHFTETTLLQLKANNIKQAFVTLHVGAGTFKPVKTDTMQQHQMHAEYIDVTVEAIEQLKNNIGKITAVGTTALRTIETVYWLGLKVYLQKNIETLELLQWDVYEQPLANANVAASVALQSLLDWMREKNKKNIFLQTQILIAPGYRFKLVNILVTNFHQPKSTLLLLVAAAIGNNWRTMYTYALQNEFRFLSYGDANIIFIDP